MTALLTLKDYLALGVTVVLAGLLAWTAHKADHWHDTWQDEKVAHQQDVIAYRSAAYKALKADQQNAARVKAEQAAINERTESEYQARLADARARADSLRQRLEAAAHSGSRPAADMPRPGSAPGSSDGAAPEDGFSVDDRLIATEQAIQLDELIKWVRKNLAVDYSGKE